MAEIKKGECHVDVSLAQTHISIPGLTPDIQGADGKIVARGNFKELSQEVKRTLAREPWFKELLKNVRQDKQSAIFYGVVGGLTIIAATTMGFEFGIRHGKDLKILPKLLKRRK